MKKNLFLLAFLFLTGFVLNAQNDVRRSSIRPTEAKKATVELQKFNNTDNNVLSSAEMRNTDIDPYKILDGNLNVIENITTGEYTYYMEKITMSGSNITNLSYTFFDDDLNEESTFSVTPPDLCRASVFSYQCNSDYYMLQLNYFEGSVNPENRKSEVWLIDNNGNTIQTFPSEGISLLFEDKLVLFPLVEGLGEDDPVQSNIRILNASTFAEEHVFAPVEMDLLYMLNAYTEFVTIGDESYIIVPQFEAPFFDENEFTYNVENNYLIFNFYSLDDYTNVKEVRMPLTDLVDVDFGPDDFAVVALEFGTFPIHKWELSTDMFNSDEKIEFIISVNYEFFMSGENYRYFYVVNEDAQILKRLEVKISTDDRNYTRVLNDIEGYDEQIVFAEFIPEGMNIFIFNVNSWEPQVRFPAIDVTTGLQMSSNIYRKPVDDGYNYLIASGTATETDGTWYGNIVEYENNGDYVGTIKLKIGQQPYRYSPMLSENAMDPTIFNDDLEVDYFNAVTFEAQGTTLYISKEDQDPFFTWTNNEEYGNIIGAGFILDLQTNKPKWFQLVHSLNNETKLLVIDLPIVKNPITIEALNPVDGSSNVALDTEIDVTFNVNIEGNDLSGITIMNSTNNPVSGVSATINGNILEISHDRLNISETYTVTIPAGAIAEYIETISWSFTTTNDSDVPSINTNEVSIYPNPSNGVINITVSETSAVEIIDLSGRIIESYNINPNSTISIEKTAGLYFVKIDSNNKTSTHKVIVR